MLENDRITAFNISELLRENKQGVKLSPTLTLGVRTSKFNFKNFKLKNIWILTLKYLECTLNYSGHRVINVVSYCNTDRVIYILEVFISIRNTNVFSI